MYFNSFGFRIAATILILLILQGCGSDRLDDYSDQSFELINQDGEQVTFPDDFNGAPLVVGFVYTHCPDICSFITANIKKVYEEGVHPEGTQFALITFDPERDTPDVLRHYAYAFEMDREPFQFLTGDPETIDELMRRVKVRTSISDEREVEGGDPIYFMSHSDKILLIDDRSRLVFEYGGSMTPVNLIAEDLEKL
ncbi:SCO family protein [Rhodohalobacter sp. SW132]|uniref:SCO family protein n=1 Tax=Rhodohalobacter sp. SW132 TaxID=2293433 RepID=UPI000E22B24D|nr:SCO family protein [Rhodohalobacter sp. SW132]REL38909.1 SCO family protein [Rhodohalobacter sp. SW132]